ncbi:MAG: DUF1917 domain-containing protein [Bdellovibrionaceae bacterium]|nr:DUF1917 domain-containing protein [Pseudobdellovibrionaceae bacterium]
MTLAPSRIKSDYWVHAAHPKPPNDWTERSGKWLIFVPLNRLDEKWALIARETELGKLGIAAKAATAKPNRLSKNNWIKVVCVYTYDSTDRQDVMRVRDHLRTLGFLKKLSYKTDKATSEGHYRINGGERVSLYFE